MRTTAEQRHRSVLAVPAGDNRKLSRALASNADEVVIDLEDAVEVGSKDRARAHLVAALRELPAAVLDRVAVRINPARSRWCHLDLAALIDLPVTPSSVVLPKVEGGGDMAFVDRLLDGLEARAPSGRRVGVQALIETAAGLAAVHEAAGVAERLDALVLGYADLSASLRMPHGPASRPDVWLPAQHSLLVAARAAGVRAVDGPYLGVDVDAAFKASVEQARILGFDGKWAIHPRQLSVLNDTFSPTTEEVAHARAVLAALDEAATSSGVGATRYKGQMLDEAVAVAARDVLRQAGARR